MPLSESQKELLLSASLDGALSPDEQAMLDQWFREDPAALRQRDELAEVNDQLRAALSSMRNAKLDGQFAERVVDAAIQQAQRENLDVGHPLVRLADRPGVADESGAPLAWRWAAIAVALAASLLVVVYVGRHDGIDADGLQRLTQVDAAEQPAEGPTAEGLAVDGHAAPALDPATTDVQEPRPVPDGATPPSLAGGPRNQSSPSSVASPELSDSGQPGVGQPAMLAETSPAVPAPRADAVDASSPQRVPLVAVLVVSVELTQEGRDSLAMLQALRAADIQLGPAGLVDEQVVAQLRQSQVIEPTDGASSTKLYYIEAPIEQLDRFLLRLMAEKSAFASFGFSLAESPGLLASVADWREVDPTTLRHADTQGLARDLVSSDGTPLAIDEGPAFIPMPREMGTAGLLASPGSGNNVTSQILLLIR